MDSGKGGEEHAGHRHHEGKSPGEGPHQGVGEIDNPSGHASRGQKEPASIKKGTAMKEKESMEVNIRWATTIRGTFMVA